MCFVWSLNTIKKSGSFFYIHFEFTQMILHYPNDFTLSIALTEEHGDYMLLGEGVLLAHAKPEDGVLSLSVAIAVCPEPIQLSSGKCAQCIICLAPIDQSSHLDFLAMLLAHINQPGWCRQLYHAGSQAELETALQDFL